MKIQSLQKIRRRQVRRRIFCAVQTLEIYATMVGEKTNNTDNEDEHNENNLWVLLTVCH